MWAGFSPCLNLIVSQNTAQVSVYFISFLVFWLNKYSHNSRRSVARCEENLQVDCSVHVAHIARTVYQNMEEPLAYLTTFRTTSNKRCTHWHLAGLLTFALGRPRNLTFSYKKSYAGRHRFHIFRAPDSLPFSLEHSLKSVRLLTIRSEVAKWTCLNDSENTEEELKL